MKIIENSNAVSGTTPTGGVAATAAATSLAAPSALAVAAERVTTDESRHLQTSIRNGVGMAAAERAVRLQSLLQEVRSGAYRPSASQLADELLAAAELGAHLAGRSG